MQDPVLPREITKSRVLGLRRVETFSMGELLAKYSLQSLLSQKHDKWQSPVGIKLSNNSILHGPVLGQLGMTIDRALFRVKTIEEFQLHLFGVGPLRNSKLQAVSVRHARTVWVRRAGLGPLARPCFRSNYKYRGITMLQLAGSRLR